MVLVDPAVVAVLVAVLAVVRLRIRPAGLPSVAMVAAVGFLLVRVDRLDRRSGVGSRLSMTVGVARRVGAVAVRLGGRGNRGVGDRGLVTLALAVVLALPVGVALTIAVVGGCGRGRSDDDDRCGRSDR